MKNKIIPPTDNLGLSVTGIIGFTRSRNLLTDKIYKTILIFIGVVGSMLCLIDTMYLAQEQTIAVAQMTVYISAAVFTALLFFGIALKKRAVVWAIMGIVFYLGLIFHREILTSVATGINAVIYEIARMASVEMMIFIVDTPVNETWAIMISTVIFSFLLCLILSLIVYNSTSFLLSVISVLPIPSIRLAFGQNTDIFGMSMIIAFLGGVFVLSLSGIRQKRKSRMKKLGKKNRYKSVVTTTSGASGLITAVLIFIVFSFVGSIASTSFERPDAVDELRENLMTLDFANVGYGDILSMDLGALDSLSYSGDERLGVQITQAEETLYLTGLIGKDYMGNYWDEDSGGSGQIQNAGLIPFEILSELFPYLIYDTNKYTDIEVESLGSDTRNYYPYYSLHTRTVDSNTNNYLTIQGKYIPYQVSQYYIQNSDLHSYISPIFINEREYREYVYTNYLEVPGYYPDNWIPSDFELEYFTSNSGVDDIYRFMEYLSYLREYFADNYDYSLSPGALEPGNDFVLDFLHNKKQGYCTYFASAATLMLRQSGIPARYANGYAVSAEDINDSDTDGSVQVQYKDSVQREPIHNVVLTDENAHAWVEVYMDGFGWVPLEVTPGGAVEGEGDLGEASSEPVTSESDSSESSTPDQSSSSLSDDTSTPSNSQSSGPQVTVESNMNFGAVLLLILPILLTIPIILIRRWMMLQRRQKRITNGSAKSRVSTIYKYLDALLKYHGLSIKSGESYADFITRIGENLEFIKQDEISQSFETVMQMRFSNLQPLETQISELLKFTQNFAKLSESRLSGISKFAYRYFKVLI